MFKSLPFKHLPRFLTVTRLPFKIALGLFVVSFFMDYQPTFGFPPIRQHIAHAQVEQTQAVNAQALPFEFKAPHSGYISTYFSFFHPGIDLATALGTPIHPVGPGTVIDTGNNIWGLGETVTIDHSNGYQSLYAHLGKILVKKGQSVTTDDVIGEVGLTGHTSGPHTHLQISKDGNNIDPLKVLPILRDHPEAQDFRPQS